MADLPPASAAADDLERPPTNTGELARKWIAELSASEKAQAKWAERVKKVERIYNDERDLSTSRGRKFNILWSNVETLRPAVYMQTPKARAVRRYSDRDPVARLASMLLQRCLQTTCELYDFDNQIDQCVRDRLLGGRGQVWVFYTPEMAGQGDNQVLAYQSVVVEYVPWQDFMHSVARNWAEVRWVARCFYKTRAELRTWLQEMQLDQSVAERVTMDYSVEGSKSDDGLKDERAKAKIWEIWSKSDGQVLYVAPGSGDDAIVGVKPPPTKYRDFWPCPRPLLATTTSKSLIPTPDYALYQDQAEELNRISERIGILQKALKAAGVYASEHAELATLLESGDNRMIPVKNWQMFVEGTGGDGGIRWFPVEKVAEVLKGLYDMREQAKQSLYEVSGIGDILRGQSDPNETLGAQKIKTQWGSLRVRRIQKDVQRLAADVMRLKAEVIAEQFSFGMIAQMAGLDQELIAKFVPQPQLPPSAPMQPQAPMPNGNGAAPPMDLAVAQMQQQAQAAAAAQAKQMVLQQTQMFIAAVEKLLRDDTARSFRIDVETDSTLEPDQQEQKSAAVEFVTALTQFMQNAAPLAAAGPEAAKMVGEILLWAVRRFGDDVDQLEQTIEQAVEAASKPQPPKPDPKMVDAQTKASESQARMKIAATESQAKTVIAAQEAQSKQAEVAGRFQLDQSIAQMTAALEQQQVSQETQAMWIKLAAEVQAMHAQTQAKTAVAAATINAKQQSQQDADGE